MMRVVQGCVALLPVVMSTVLLQLAPVTGLRYPQSPDTSPQQLRQYLHDVPPSDLHHSPDDHPTPSWHNSAKPQEYHLDGLPDDGPETLPTDFPLQQYLQGGPSVLQDGDTIQQYPRTTYHEPGSWWHPAAPHASLPNDPYAHRNTHHAYDNTNDALRNSLHLYDEDEDDDDVHPNSIAAQQAAGEATHHDVGDTYRNLREGEAAGEEEELMASPILPCWHYLPPEPTWCPSILFQLASSCRTTSPPVTPPSRLITPTISPNFTSSNNACAMLASRHPNTPNAA
ncbi:uncharacterized protein [Panulirus ornatus]|uniref:uncharacterized protein isoform X2 n=1 Tax=Panulirus ornatus TaxID=150431 RepID=UPI003A875A55